MKVHYDEGVAIYIGPEPCVGVREGGDEASVGEGIGQPLSRESSNPGADVQTLLAREPGDLAIDRSAIAAGPHREGEEP